ncbi:hypothetical protein [uncultured Psychroserpens sp.]|uniref:hypothetical protein n=1 Tax=uncultured Psychroserpens sp. TaxID=255436 RepID=UPI00260C85BB|nr:hypothetical protein [uncultured Psychroserpens sp.]
MLKKLVASSMMLAMVFTMSLNVYAQDSEDYTMWETLMFTPDYTKLKTLQENMRKHNQTYHKDAPYTANVYNITSGPNAGRMIWQMGPMMFKHNDSRPGEGGHDADWRDNVMPYVKEIQTIEYWSQDDELSNTSMLTGPEVKYPILYVRFFEVDNDHGYSLRHIFKQVSATVKSLEGENPWGLYYNNFLQGNLGRHIATVGFSKNWADFDRDMKFKEAFVKIHGENSWDTFLDTLDGTFTNRWDEIWAYNKNLSGR